MVPVQGLKVPATESVAPLDVEPSKDPWRISCDVGGTGTS